MIVRLTRVLATLVACGMIGFGAFAGILSDRFLSYPRRAILSENRIVPCPVKSIVVFVTPMEKKEYDIAELGFAAFISAFGILVVVEFLTRDFRRGKPD